MARIDDWGRDLDKIERDWNPMLDMTRLPDGRWISKQAWVDEQVAAYFRREREARQRWEQDVKDNPLMVHRRELRKQPQAKGGRGKCIICNHPYRGKIELLYRNKLKNTRVTHQALKQAGMKISYTAVWNHFRKHYCVPVMNQE
ncbi:MAG: hypothetical protein P8123_03785 [bacterium]